MFSITTSEIRWFFRGKTPATIQAWLKSLDGLFEEQPPRTDIYLRLADMKELGIKLREGRIELKKRTAIHEAYEGRTLSGRVETWIKWSLAIEDAGPDMAAAFLDREHWVQVGKERWLKKYAISDKHGLIPPPATGFPARGIAVELSNLEIHREPWWTFGLECFGNTGETLRDLIHFLPHLTTDFPREIATLEHSAGYPEWIGVQ